MLCNKEVMPAGTPCGPTTNAPCTLPTKDPTEKTLAVSIHPQMSSNDNNYYNSNKKIPTKDSCWTPQRTPIRPAMKQSPGAGE